MSRIASFGKNFSANFQSNFRIKIIEKKSWRKLVTKNRKNGKNNKYSKRIDLRIQKGNEGTQDLGGGGINLAKIAKATRNFSAM